MNAKQRLRQIQGLLRQRELIYVGPRGTDALLLAPLGSLSAVFSLIAPAASGVSETCLETLSGVRVDLNGYSLDNDRSASAVQLRDALIGSLSRPCAVLPYSPWRTLSQGWLIARDKALPLGLFHAQQTCFEDKPWVESELRRWGIETIPWTYVRTLSSSHVTDLLDRRAPVVVRWSRSRGGAGIWLIRDRGDLASVAEPPLGEELFCVAPFFAEAISVNVNACVFSEGEVSIHGSSVQLVGIEICTPRSLGYAGNDFASISDLPAKALQDLDSMARSIGAWLVRHGYLGAFGFDALVLGERVLFVELNPRFQASSAVASQLDDAIGRPNQYHDHIAAFLGLEGTDRVSLAELVKKQEPLSYIVVFNGRGERVELKQKPRSEGRDVRLLPGPGITVEPHGTLAAILWNGRVTESGRELRKEASAAVLNLLKCFSPREP
jgi:hypothetical protein